jgi:class 3 adenylate cyclase
MRSDVAFYLRQEAVDVARRVARVRVVAILAGMAILTPIGVSTGRPGVLLTLLVGGVWLVSAFAVERWLAVSRDRAGSAYATIALDIAFLTVLILATGLASGDATVPPRVPHVFFYPAIVAIAALYQSPRLCLTAALAAAGAFLALSVPALVLAPHTVTADMSTEFVSIPRALAVAASFIVLGAILAYGVARTRGLVSRALDTRTFLFADLRDYTSFVERRGDAAAAELIAAYRALVRTEVARTGGGEIKTEGDSFYIVFPSARQALDCAVGILRAADAASSRGVGTWPIKVGVGLHAGEPVPHAGQFVGSAVNIAARLCQNAAAGELLVSEVVRGLLRTSGLPPTRERAEVVLKGISDPPRVYSVAWDEAPRG